MPDRPATDWLAEKGLNGTVDVARSHGLALIREHADDRVQDPVVPAVPTRDWRPRLPAFAATGVAAAPGGIYAGVRYVFQQGFQASRGVGMVSG